MELLLLSPILIGIWVVSIVAGTMIGAKKGEGIISFILCCLFGPLWLIVVIASTGNKIKCIYCQEYIDKKAIICPHCRKDVIPYK